MQQIIGAQFEELTMDELIHIDGGTCTTTELRTETLRGIIKGGIAGMMTGSIKGALIGATIGGLTEAIDYNYTCRKQ